PAQCSHQSNGSSVTSSRGMDGGRPPAKSVGGGTAAGAIGREEVDAQPAADILQRFGAEYFAESGDASLLQVIARNALVIADPGAVGEDVKPVLAMLMPPHQIGRRRPAGDSAVQLFAGLAVDDGDPAPIGAPARRLGAA